ncbi:hypothetical protein GGI04_001372 [Coemansia thaxteri]|nr:hypothetical protein GGI04_001372 [Coemansia thaxteri]
MKLSKVASVVSLVAAVHGVNIYYQPDGIFVPNSISLPLVTQAQPAVQQQQAAQQLAPAPAKAPQESSSWSWSNILGLGDEKSATYKESSLSTIRDPATSTLVQILTPLRPVLIKFLTNLQTRFDKADPKVLANAIRGPINEVKEYLKSHWPTSASTKLLTPPASTKLPTPPANPRPPPPAIRGASISAWLDTPALS